MKSVVGYNRQELSFTFGQNWQWLFRIKNV